MSEMNFLTLKSQNGNIFVSKTLNSFQKGKKKNVITQGVEVFLNYLLITHSGWGVMLSVARRSWVQPLGPGHWCSMVYQIWVMCLLL